MRRTRIRPRAEAGRAARAIALGLALGALMALGARRRPSNPRR